jgi:hypothetical protein
MLRGDSALDRLLILATVSLTAYGSIRTIDSLKLELPQFSRDELGLHSSCSMSSNVAYNFTNWLIVGECRLNQSVQGKDVRNPPSRVPQGRRFEQPPIPASQLVARP